MMAADAQTCCTVETPSRLMLFYPESAPCSLTSLLPTLPLCKPVGHQLVMGRSSVADVRLNDERMSRAYAALWHDGKDPFVFRVSNVSERKLLTVDGAMLRYQEEAEVKDGSVLVLDFLELKAKVCAGDVVAFNYEVSFVKNVVMSQTPLKPPDGKCLMPALREEKAGSIVSPCGSGPCKAPLESPGEAVNRLLTCLRLGSVDSGVGSCKSSSSGAAGSLPTRSHSCCDSVGIEYELPENVCSASSGCSSAGKEIPPLSDFVLPFPKQGGDNIPLNIDLRRSSCAGQSMLPTTAGATPELSSLKLPHLVSSAPNPASQTSTQQSLIRKNVSCWFNINPDPSEQQPQKENSEKNVEDLPGHARDNQVNSKQNVCPSCRGCGEGALQSVTLVKSGPGQQTLTLPDMVMKQGKGRRSPVENAEWDTDDPNINCYMD